MSNSPEVVIRAKNIVKVYPGTTALKNVDFEVYAGKVNVLIGENGAGKSTLMKILAGIEQPTEGTIEVDGNAVSFHNTREASENGIGIIHQELNLFNNMTVVENMFVGKEISKGLSIDRKKQIKIAREALEKMKLFVDPQENMQNLRVGQQQIIEITKTMLQRELRVLIMDEPTSSLSNAEVEILFDLISELKRQNIAIIYISHRLEEIIRIGDYVTILRDGSRVADDKVENIDVGWIVRQMVGDTSIDVEKIPYTGDKQEVLRVENLALPKMGGGYIVDHIDFTVHKGEVLGIYGLMGAGRTEAMECIMGLHPESSGNIYLHGQKLPGKGVGIRIAQGLTLVPEDRQSGGLVQTMTVEDNLVLTGARKYTKYGRLRRKSMSADVNRIVQDLFIKVSNVKNLITSLSGGNQQKVVIGKSILSEPQVILLDEPSRGIDVGAKADVFRIMRRFAAGGMGIVFVGSELKEIIAVCDRVIVMSEGKLTAEFSGGEISEEALIIASTAGKKNRTA